MQFYSLLGYVPTTKFLTGPAKAAWLQVGGNNGAQISRLELIEVPSYMLQEPEGKRRRALDLFQRQDLLGLNHLALDVTCQIEKDPELRTLQDWLEALNQTSVKKFDKTLRVALAPQQQLIGRGVYELAFLFDADGALVELLRKLKDLPQEISSGWEPWDGKGFIGPSMDIKAADAETEAGEQG